MNLSGKFYVKSNYIRAAKENWVLCEVRLLTDDVDTFLCIKSLSNNGSGELDEKNSNVTDAEKKYRFNGDRKGKSINFTALCNLSVYKSCSVRTVTVNDQDSFAIRLVPAGVIGNKHLLIASVDENEITTWLSICKSSIGKKGKQQQNKDNFSTAGTLSKSSSFLSLKPMTTSFDADFDEGLLDNEVYEAYSSEDKIPALLEEAGDWIKLRLNQPECYLRLTEERLEVLDAITQKPVQWFPYLLIRRFGAANGVLRVDAGRRCSTGDGRFFFRCSPPNGQPVDMLVTQIRQLALEAKQRLKRTQMSSSSIELSDRSQLRSSSVHTPDNSVTNDLDADFQSAGTLPRVRSKRVKPPLNPPVDRSTKLNGMSNSLAAPKATPELSDDPEAARSDSGTDGCEIVRATPVKLTKSPADLPATANLYDNLPRPPRKGSRLPGAVNVLPLPVRAKPKEANDSTRNHSYEPRSPRSNDPEKSHENGHPDTATRPAATPRTQATSSTTTNEKTSTTSPVSKFGAIPNTEDVLSSQAPATSIPITVSANGLHKQTADEIKTPQTPAATSARPKQVNCTEPTRQPLWNQTQSDVVKSPTLAQCDLPNHVAKTNTTAPVVNTSTTMNGNTIGNSATSTASGNIAGAQSNSISPTVVMRVPPFTAPKPNVTTTSSTPHAASTPASPTEARISHTDVYPIPLSRMLNSKISTTSLYLRGPHPNLQKEPVHCTQVNINPTPSVSAMVNRLNADWRASKAVQKIEPVSRSTPETTQSAAGLDEDPKNYLSELDSVIKELCEANEAAVQATREAARRRHQLGWPTQRNDTALTSNTRHVTNT